MIILYVHETFGALAGAEQNILVTGEALKNRGHQLHFLYHASSTTKEDVFNKIFTKHQLPFDNSTSPQRAENIIRLVQQIQPDIMYVHKNTDTFLLANLFACGKPMVRMTHDHDTYCLRSYRYNYFSRRPCRRKAGLACLFPCLGFMVRNKQGLLPIKINSLTKKLREIEINKKFDLIFAVTDYMKNEFILQGFDPLKIKIFPPIPRPQNQTFTSNFSDKNIIIYAGQIIRGKGVDCLIKAVAKIKTPYKLLVIGSGSHEKTCKKLAKKLQISENISFLGWVDQTELQNYYREATVVVVPSVWPEPIATIGLEVGRFSLPAIAFDAGGISDWLKDGQNGYLIEWMNIASMAEKIEKLLGDKNLARAMGTKALELVNQNYDFDRYIENIEKTFNQLIVSSR